MISAEEFCDALVRRGFVGACGVPCSSFGGPIALLEREKARYVPTANEGTAFAVAAGSHLAGSPVYVLLQNSGFGNLVNPLTSLAMPCDLPILSFVSLRGYPSDRPDEPQHEVMGRITQPLIDVIGLPYRLLPTDADLATFEQHVDSLLDQMAGRRPGFLLVERGAVGAATPSGQSNGYGAATIASDDAMATILAVLTDSVVVASTGYTSRELYGLADNDSQFYMQGSMGHASAIGLGIARSQKDRRVVVIEGDGSALMHLGAFTSVGHVGPTNFVHVVLDNGMHESTGGQRTGSESVDFDVIARSSSYRSAAQCRTSKSLAASLLSIKDADGPHFIVVHTAPRDAAHLPRVTRGLGAAELAIRLKEHLAQERDN